MLIKPSQNTQVMAIYTIVCVFVFARAQILAGINVPMFVKI